MTIRLGIKHASRCGTVLFVAQMLLFYFCIFYFLDLAYPLLNLQYMCALDSLPLLSELRRVHVFL